MPPNVFLPQWGMNMQEGTLLKWLKQEGDSVEKGEALVEVETAKINSELEAPASGVLARIAAPEGTTVNVGPLRAIIAAPGEEVALPPPVSPAAPAPATRPARPSSTPTVGPSRQGTSGVQVVPAARRLAQAHGIDLNTVAGSGRGGRVMEDDVQRLIEAQAAVSQVIPLAGMRRTIAARMLQSTQTMAQVTLTTEADVTESTLLREDLVSRWRAQRTRPVALALLVKTAARALAEHPYLNATLADGTLRLMKEINIGFAVSIEDGLIAPVVRHADEKSLLDINREVVDLAKEAREGQLSPDQVTGATFTITDLGSFDIDAFTPIIDPPQVAVLGVGRVVEKPMVHLGEVSKRSMMALSLTFDHRATDGAPAGRFLQAIKRYLEAPGRVGSGA